MNLYDFEVTKNNGEVVSLKTYQGKVLLIVNTATKCGYTPQYEGLETLYQEYKDSGFEILDFPCNQFANQAPGTNDEVKSFCQLKYHTTFQTFDKIQVNGDQAAPLYTFLKEQQPALSGKAIKWNFTKFLVNRQGEVVKRYGSAKKPENMAKEIAGLLAEN